jgi:hypothetical protein
MSHGSSILAAKGSASSAALVDDLRCAATLLSGREAKFYRLTRAGRAQLQKELEQWERLSGAVGLVICMLPEASA